MNMIFNRLLLGLVAMFFATAAIAQSEYRARVGDKVVVEVVEDASLNRVLEILPDGRINFPFAGSIRAKGRTVGQIEASITNGIASQFSQKPTVFLSIQPKERIIKDRKPVEPETINIYFLGEIKTPGIVKVEPGTTLLQALAQSGGFTNFAATKRIQVRSVDDKTGVQSISSFNYKGTLEGAVALRDPTLNEGDVILVPARKLFE